MSFLDVLKIHEYLDELFLQHQEALLQLDIELAAERLRFYECQLHIHMQVEEELLLPVYARAGKIPGGPPEFFTGEHQRMREFLTRFTATLVEMNRDRTNLPRRVLALFDEEAMYKNLCLHHDQRERNLFFPTLDRVTGEAERRDLIARCLTAPAR
ncbi:MAG: hemerythrin domain-containing protein [Blastocatellia bacterium]|nr:hemerythrin domain-containing protein [Blastocatellia bacterium]